MRLHDHLDYHALQAPDSPFALFGGHTLSYARAREEAERIAGALEASGLGIGERVAILARNCTELALFYYGCSMAGVAPVPPGSAGRVCGRCRTGQFRAPLLGSRCQRPRRVRFHPTVGGFRR